MQKFIISVVFLISNLASANLISGDANSLQFVFKGDTKWELSEDSRNRFNDFLKRERQKLRSEIAGLDLPESFESVQSGIRDYALPTSQTYKNRDISCAFLRKVHNSLVRTEDQAELNILTRGGTVCTQRDLDPALHSEWTLSLIRFFWTKKWISVGSTNESLKDYLIRRFQIENFPDIKFEILTSTEFDAYGYNFSSEDLEVIRQNPKLSAIFEKLSKLSPNDPRTWENFGEDFKNYMKANPAAAAGSFIAKPTIYITNNWSPLDLVEILTHEFGHVYHGDFKRSIFDHGDQIVVRGSRVHDEGAAEATAWVALCPLYSNFPEIALFHILKLSIFSQHRPDDPHYVGAAAFADQFHYQCPGDMKSYNAFLRSESPQAFMTELNFFPLSMSGVDSDTNLKLNW